MKAAARLEQWVARDGLVAPLLLSGDSGTLAHAVDELVETAIDTKQVVPAEVWRVQDTERTVSIAEVRGILERVALTSTGAYQLIIVPGVERVSVPAANALLKSLEEASSTTRWVLTTAWPSRLLSTLRSRCEAVRLPYTSPSLDPELLSRVFNKTLLERLAKGQELDAEEVDGLGVILGEYLRRHGPRPELVRAFMRLRDYYLIAAGRGNVSLAQEVLLSSLPERPSGRGGGHS